MDYRKHFSTRSTSQTAVIPGREADMAANNGGGVSFVLDKWKRLEQFLILGSEGGTYYVKEQKLTEQNGTNIIECLKEDAKRVVDTILDVSLNARAPKQDPTIFAYALACSWDTPFKSYALNHLEQICRTGTMLFKFVHYVKGFRGWGSSLKKAVQKWYLDKPTDKLAYQLVKYKQRDGWSHRDVLRLCHAKTANVAKNECLRYAVKGEFMHPKVDHSVETDAKAANLIHAVERIQRITHPGDVPILIANNRIPYECVPDIYKSRADVWEALLENMPMTNMVRNLNKMTEVGLLTHSSKATQDVIAKLENTAEVHKSRIHPMQALMAYLAYSSGKGMKGSKTWTPVPRISEALMDLFYSSVKNVHPTGKRILFALDVSGSMTMGSVAGNDNLDPRTASAALAMISAQTEEQYQFMAFSSGFIPLNITRRDNLQGVIKTVSNLPFDSTDCALPMTWATKNKLDFDAFVVYTDSETNYSRSMQPSLALQQYRLKRGIPAKLVVVGMVSNGFTIADPTDAGMLDVVGFDAAAPGVISDFIRS